MKKLNEELECWFCHRKVEDEAGVYKEIEKYVNIELEKNPESELNILDDKQGWPQDWGFQKIECHFDHNGEIKDLDVEIPLCPICNAFFGSILLSSVDACRGELEDGQFLQRGDILKLEVVEDETN